MRATDRNVMSYVPAEHWTYSLFTVITSPSVGFSGKISPSAFLGRKRSSALMLTAADLSIRPALSLDEVVR